MDQKLSKLEFDVFHLDQKLSKLEFNIFHLFVAFDNFLKKTFFFGKKTAIFEGRDAEASSWSAV